VIWAEKSLRRLSVRFCPAIYKDVVQTRNRLRRKAVGEARLYEAYTPEGTIVRAEIAFPSRALAKAKMLEEQGLGVIEDGVFVTHPQLIRCVGDALKGRARLAEYHPTSARLLISAREGAGIRGIEGCDGLDTIQAMVSLLLVWHSHLGYMAAVLPLDHIRHSQRGLPDTVVVQTASLDSQRHLCLPAWHFPWVGVERLVYTQWVLVKTYEDVELLFLFRP
jgi:hypothetical protein